MVSVKNLAWAAGFLEGEGCFGISGRSGFFIDAPQVIKEPLERLRQMFGGSIYYYERLQPSRSKPIYRWKLYGRQAVGVMMTLYGLMSRKRQEQMKRALTYFKSTLPKAGLRPICKNGHSITSPSTYYVRKNGGRNCKMCILNRLAKE